MTLASTTSKLLYNGDGSTTVFAISFIFWQNSDIKVVHRDASGAETTWAEGTHYTLTGGLGSTGTLTVKTAPTDYTPASGEKLLIKSALTETQDAALPLGGAFPSTTVEQMADIVTRLVQQHSEEIARSFIAAETDDNPGVIPSSTDRAGKYLAFDVSGNAIAADAPANTSVVTTFGASLIDDADAQTARETLGLGSNADGGITLTSTDAGSGIEPVVILDRNSASPAVNDWLGSIEFRGRDDAGGTPKYARLFGRILDPTNASEDGALFFQLLVAGVETTIFALSPGMSLGAPTGGDKGIGTINAENGLYIDGVQAGRVVQVVQTHPSAVSTGTTVLPADDTIPQNTEGDEVMTLAITPKSATSRLYIQVIATGSISAGQAFQAALFKDSDAGALAAGGDLGNSLVTQNVTISHDMVSGGTSEITFKVRVGCNAAATTTFNGFGSVRKYGGVASSSITITEYMP